MLKSCLNIGSELLWCLCILIFSGTLGIKISKQIYSSHNNLLIPQHLNDPLFRGLRIEQSAWHSSGSHDTFSQGRVYNLSKSICQIRQRKGVASDGRLVHGVGVEGSMVT